jgi:hypothetical protein
VDFILRFLLAIFYPRPVPEFDLDSKGAGYQLHILLLMVVSFSVIASLDVTPEIGDKGEKMEEQHQVVSLRAPSAHGIKLCWKAVEEQHSYVDNPLLTTVINKLHIIQNGLPSQ